MLRPTVVRAAHVHKPLIRFPDRRAPKSTFTSSFYELTALSLTLR